MSKIKTGLMSADDLIRSLNVKLNAHRAYVFEDAEELSFTEGFDKLLRSHSFLMDQQSQLTEFLDEFEETDNDMGLDLDEDGEVIIDVRQLFGTIETLMKLRDALFSVIMDHDLDEEVIQRIKEQNELIKIQEIGDNNEKVVD